MMKYDYSNYNWLSNHETAMQTKTRRQTTYGANWSSKNKHIHNYQNNSRKQNGARWKHARAMKLTYSATSSARRRIYKSMTGIQTNWLNGSFARRSMGKNWCWHLV